MYVGGCFDKYISAATWPPQIKIPSSAPARCAISLDKKITTRYTGSTWSLPTPWRYINHKPKRRVHFLLFISSCSDCLLRFPRSFTASLPPSLSLSLSLSLCFDVVGDSPENRRPYGWASECRRAKRKMKIFVKTLKGTHFEIEVKPEDSVPILLLLISQLLEILFYVRFLWRLCG